MDQGNKNLGTKGLPATAYAYLSYLAERDWRIAKLAALNRDLVWKRGLRRSGQCLPGN